MGVARQHRITFTTTLPIDLVQRIIALSDKTKFDRTLVVDLGGVVKNDLQPPKTDECNLTEENYVVLRKFSRSTLTGILLLNHIVNQPNLRKDGYKLIKEMNKVNTALHRHAKEASKHQFRGMNIGHVVEALLLFGLERLKEQQQQKAKSDVESVDAASRSRRHVGKAAHKPVNPTTR